MKVLFICLAMVLLPLVASAAESVPSMPPPAAFSAPAPASTVPSGAVLPDYARSTSPASPASIGNSGGSASSGGLATPQAQAQPSPVSSAPSHTLDPQWLPLLQRLAADGISGPEVDALFMRMGAPTQDPMGRKVRELYVRKFVPPTPRDPSIPPPPRRTVYKNVITPENVERCRQFLRDHAPAFALAEVRYQVPKEIAVALLFVETRLGNFLGDTSALYTLSSMAASTSPDHITQWLPKLPGYEDHLDWMTELMPKRADWAYKELRALLAFTRQSSLDPLSMPGSIYGAIGMCQFMPSNLNAYAADGDNDGEINLFTTADAVASLSNYLVKNGWKGNLNRKQQHAALKRYNKLDIYANTILVLGDAVAGRCPAVSPDDPARQKK